MEFAIYTISMKGIFLKEYEIHKNDQLIYRVRRPSFLAFSELIFYDSNDNEVLAILKKFALFKYEFEIFEGRDLLGRVEKQTMENFYLSSGIHGVHSIEGDFFQREYTVIKDEIEIAKVSRKRFRSKRKYGIAIKEGYNELYILALIIIVSFVNRERKKKR